MRYSHPSSARVPPARLPSRRPDPRLISSPDPSGADATASGGEPHAGSRLRAGVDDVGSSASALRRSPPPSHRRSAPRVRYGRSSAPRPTMEHSKVLDILLGTPRATENAQSHTDTAAASEHDRFEHVTATSGRAGSDVRVGHRHGVTPTSTSASASRCHRHRCAAAPAGLHRHPHRPSSPTAGLHRGVGLDAGVHTRARCPRRHARRAGLAGVRARDEAATLVSGVHDAGAIARSRLRRRRPRRRRWHPPVRSGSRSAKPQRRLSRRRRHRRPPRSSRRRQCTSTASSPIAAFEDDEEGAVFTADPSHQLASAASMATEILSATPEVEAVFIADEERSRSSSARTSP